MDWARIEAKFVPEPNSGCWLWTAATTCGYGYIWNPDRQRVEPAHRLLYEMLVGPIPEGLDLDHLCRVRCCINPDHLEPVTRKENLRRGIQSGGAHQRAKTHCPQGHAYDEANTWHGRGERQCRACARERATRVRRARGVTPRALRLAD